MTTCEVSLSSSDHLAGDVIRATVSFKGKNDTVEWAAVQIHGHCWHDARLVASVAPSPAVSITPKTMKSRRSSSTTSLNQTAGVGGGSATAGEKKTAMPDMSTWVEGTTCLFATQAHCIAAELALQGEHAYSFQACLPPVLPPSFRGVSTRYGYLLTVCVKLRSEDSARVAHIPFYVAGTPGSLGDAARMGQPSSAFLESLSSHAGGPRRNSTRARDESSEEEEELVMLQNAMHEAGVTTDGEFVNRFPQRYVRWDSSVRSTPQDVTEKIWFLERDEADDDNGESHLPMPSPRLNDPHFDFASHAEGVITRALNAQTAKGRLARCYVLPSSVTPGDAMNVRLDFTGAVERSSKVQASIEVEERTTGPPPLVAVFEPLLRKRQGAGPWIRVVATKAIDVTMCSSCAFSLSTYGAPPDFSTDLIMVHSYLKLEFTTPSMVCSLRVPLNVRPPARATKIVSFAAADLNSFRNGSEGKSSPTPSKQTTVHPLIARRLEEQSPPPTPNKTLVF